MNLGIQNILNCKFTCLCMVSNTNLTFIHQTQAIWYFNVFPSHWIPFRETPPEDCKYRRQSQEKERHPRAMLSLRDQLRLRDNPQAPVAGSCVERRLVPRIVVDKPLDNISHIIQEPKASVMATSVRQAKVQNKGPVKLLDSPKTRPTKNIPKRETVIKPGAPNTSSSTSDSTTQPTSPSSGMLGSEFCTTNSISVWNVLPEIVG